MSELSYVRKRRNKLLPIGAIHRNGPAVLTPASSRQEQGRRLGECNRGLIDRQPSGINSGSPLDVIKWRRGRLLFLLSAGILELNVEDDVRIGKSDSSHELGKVSFRWDKSRSCDASGAGSGGTSHGWEGNLR